jgi:hypothetical protein
MRLHRLSPAEVAEIIAEGRVSRIDPDGRPIFAGRVRDGRLMEVVIALDDPGYVITVFGEVD